MFKDISDALLPMLEAKGLNRHLTKTWVYRRKCLVLAFRYKDVKFAFDVTPSMEGSVSIDLVQRKSESNICLTASGRGKERIAQELPLVQAFEFLHAEALRVFCAIDSAGKSSLPVDVIEPSPANAAKKKVLASEAHIPPMKIGVLTLPFNANIGGNLQGYALMEVLRQLGHQPVLVNRRRAPKGTRVDKAALVDQTTPLISNLMPISQAPNRAFIEEHIVPISREFLSTSQLSSNVDRYGFDAIVVGSDQVWRPKYAKSILTDFFLGFLPEHDRKTKRISYAASFGTSDWEYDAEQTALVATLSARFDAISVREDSGVALCRERLGVEARHVLDPTLLLTADHYLRLFSSRQTDANKGKLLGYVLDRSEDKIRIIDALSKRLSIDAYSTNGRPFDPANPMDLTEGDKTVEGWLAAIYNSAFVVTDSFHGTAFSILFNKPFIAYGNPKRGMARFTSLLKLFGLEDRLLVKTADFHLEKMVLPINWTAVNKRLEALRIESKQFLELALTGDFRSEKPTMLQSAAASDLVADDAAPRIAIGRSGNDHPLNVLCTGCGACVSESRGALRMGWSEDGFLMPQAASQSIPTEAIRVCPFNPRPEESVKDEDALAGIFLPGASRFDLKAGRFENCYVGYSKKFRPTSSSGGVATYVFSKLLEQGHVDYLVVVQSDGSNGYQYQILRKTDDIRQMSKTRYFPVSLDGLFAIIERTEGRVAVSGVACFIKAIRLKQHYHPELKDKIPFLVGIICGGLKSRLYTDFLAQSAGIEGSYTRPEYRVKDPNSSANDYSFSAVDEKSEIHTVKMKRLGDMWGSGLFKSRACDFCSDVLTELADISVGDAWLPDYKRDGRGNSVVVTRTALAEEIIRHGIEAGELAVEEVPVARVIRSQAGGLNHKQNTLKFRVWMAKYFSDLPIPNLRDRLLKSTPLPDAIIQLFKERTRSKSLAYWLNSSTLGAFNDRMHSSRAALGNAKAARQVARDGGSHPLMALLTTRRLDMLRSEEGEERGGQILRRWLRRMVRGRQFNVDALRSALLEAEVVHTRELHTKPKSDKP